LSLIVASLAYAEPAASLPDPAPIAEVSSAAGDLVVTVQAAPATVLLQIHDVNLTFYDCAEQGFCGAMFNGIDVYEGAAACSWDLEIGTLFRVVGDPTLRVYECTDRGHLSDTWVDIFWYYPADGWAWQDIVGRYGTIEVVALP
jgi:hypothetical protein